MLKILENSRSVSLKPFNSKKKVTEFDTHLLNNLEPMFHLDYAHTMLAPFENSEKCDGSKI